MSLLSDDDKALLVLEHLGPAALAGDTMSLYDCFQLALDVAEKAVLAKLATAELPPLPAYECGPHTGHAAVRTDESIRAYGLQAHAQGFAAGAASQLSAEPVGFVHEGELDTAMTLKTGYAHLYPVQHPSTSTPLYTRREAK